MGTEPGDRAKRHSSEWKGNTVSPLGKQAHHLTATLLIYDITNDQGQNNIPQTFSIIVRENNMYVMPVIFIHYAGMQTR
jgi:hypothetical protein